MRDPIVAGLKLPLPVIAVKTALLRSAFAKIVVNCAPVARAAIKARPALSIFACAIKLVSLSVV